MTDLWTVHTADLEATVLTAARALLDDAFDGDFSDHDWENALGGMHALLWEDGELIGHASLVQRRLMHNGRALRTGYVEAVAVGSEHRRRGHGSTMMDALERVTRKAYDLGALSASEEAMEFYASRGWLLWRGTSSAMTPSGVKATKEEDGSIHVLPVGVTMDLDGEITADWREGDVW
ncbi:GNAT family N-acetyltransferase [Amycolatopsis pittospori]|uniref:GNAT family N-acetyltransferase n=1 Tax=Amycolatopsis pittospori TaxID=2749434 RepID=UPI0015F022D1|nr:GNAT family N-acetyltransferase [Amycolatopsis pittospori]